MNDHDHDHGLSPAAHAALAALRAEDDLPADARARVWARLADAQAVPLDMSHAPSRRGRGWTGAVIGLAIAAGVALALVGPGRGAQELARTDPASAAAYDDAGEAQRLAARPAGPTATPTTPPTKTQTTPTPTTPTRVDAPAVDPVVTPAVVADPPRRTRERTGPVPEDSSTLAAETALLQRAQAALAADDAGAALARLDEHARQFARGVLARERDALRVTALCAAGRRDEGEAAAARFLAAHGGSLLAGRVRGACDAP